METLAMGLAFICLLYIFLLLGMAWWLDQWEAQVEEELWNKMKNATRVAWRNLTGHWRNDNSRRAA